MKKMQTLVAGLTMAVVMCVLGAGGARGQEQGASRWLADGERGNDKWLVEDEGSTFSVDGTAARSAQLTLGLEAVKRGPVTMTIESDAAYVNVQVGGKRVRLDLGGEDGNNVTRTVRMKTGSKAMISLDDKTDDKWNDAWKQGVENEKAKGVELRFARSSWVKIKLLQGQAEVEDEVSVPAATVGAVTEVKGPMSAEDLQKLTENAVLEMAVSRGDGALATAATVTVLDVAGHGVAVLHELLGATKVEARRVGFAEAMPVELMAVDSEHDLALVKLDLSNPLARAVVRYVTPAEDEPKVGDKLWALAPTTTRNDATAGTVIALTPGGGALQAMSVVKVVASTADLDRRTQAVLTHSPSSKWLEVDAVLDTAHSGGAVVNERGELVGIGSWTWVAKRKSSPVLSAVHVKQLLADHADDVAGAELGWKGLAEMTPGPAMRFTTFPRLAGAVPSDAAMMMGQTDDPQRWLEVRKMARMLELGAFCPVCKGEGLFYQRKQAGVSRGGGLAVPQFVNMPEICSRCGGTGLNEAGTLEPMLDKVVLGVAKQTGGAGQVPGDDNKNWVTTRDQMLEILTTLSEEHYPGLSKMSDATVKDLIQGGPAKIGQPMVVVGTLVKKVEIPGALGSGKLTGLRLGDVRTKDAQRVLVGDVVYEGQADQRLAMVMGVLEGWVIYNADEPPVAVVGRAWVLPVDQAKVDAAAKKQKDAIDAAEQQMRDIQRAIQLQDQQRQQSNTNNNNNDSNTTTRTNNRRSRNNG